MSSIRSTNIKDCYLIYPDTFGDHRGIFSEIYKSNLYTFMPPIQQLNYSSSKKGTLRGIHKTPYGKLITCVQGSILDVCVDLRPDSQTYNQHISFNLNESNLFQVYIPPYCGHAFYALSDCTVIYAQDAIYTKYQDETFCYKNFSIAWPEKPIFISDRDEGACNEIS